MMRTWEQLPWEWLAKVGEHLAEHLPGWEALDGVQEDLTESYNMGLTAEEAASDLVWAHTN